MKARSKAVYWAMAAAVAVFIAVAGMMRPDVGSALLEREYAIGPSRFVTVDDVRFHIRDRGQGPAIVLLHGQSANAFVWEGWADGLSADHRVISVDLPGHGLTGPDPRARYTWPGMAELVFDLTQALNLRTFVLAGNSLGGAISLELALAHPSSVESLVLVDAIGSPRDEPKPLIFEAYATPVIGWLLSWLTPEWIIRSNLESTYGDPSKVSDADVRVFQAMMLRQGNRAAARQIVSYVPSGELVRRIAEVNLPVLILWGGRDTWTLPKYGHWFEEHMPNAELRVFDDLGHMPMAEDPVSTLATLREFLERKGRPSSKNGS